MARYLSTNCWLYSSQQLANTLGVRRPQDQSGMVMLAKALHNLRRVECCRVGLGHTRQAQNAAGVVLPDRGKLVGLAHAGS